MWYTYKACWGRYCNMKQLERKFPAQQPHRISWHQYLGCIPFSQYKRDFQIFKLYFRITDNPSRCSTHGLQRPSKHQLAGPKSPTNIGVPTLQLPQSPPWPWLQPRDWITVAYSSHHLSWLQLLDTLHHPRTALLALFDPFLMPDPHEKSKSKILHSTGCSK